MKVIRISSTNILDGLPDVSFVDDMSLDDMLEDMERYYNNKLQELTGKEVVLSDASPYRAILYACAVMLYQDLQFIDRAGKQNLTKYSYGPFLDHLGSLKGVFRNTETKSAHVKVRFSLQDVNEMDVIIPAGTRVVYNEIYFENEETKMIKAGELFIDIDMLCTEDGEIGNDIQIGTIQTLADPIAFVSEVSNITVSSGGTGIEDDESFAERIFLAPSSYSVAGVEDAYKYWAKTFDQSIGEVTVNSIEKGVVNVFFILKNHKLPDDTMIAQMQDFLSDKKRRPLTDRVVVSAPSAYHYDIEVSYWINKEQQVSQMKEAVEVAVEEYVDWQQEKIGRNINPSELIRRMSIAGASRIEVIKPAYEMVSVYALPTLRNKNIIYEGLVDD